MHRLLTATAAAALAAAFATGAQAQTPATAKTEAEAKAATGKATTDQPAATQAQGAAKAVQQGAAPVAAAQGAAPSTPVASGAQVAPSGDIIETARASGQFTTFLKAADATNLTALMKNNKNLTVFAPTDAAFQSLPAGELARLMGDKAALQKLITHHIINAPVDSAKISGAKGPVPSVAQDSVLLDGSEPGVLKADGATIVQADVRASNGILHVVDKVLIAGQGDAGQAAAATTGTATGASATATPDPASSTTPTKP
ncbi:fasciclin domain-containing protein [Phenylobacterium sp. J367]|uniref:fasciclin domain-containing protein n=1 Tax=Phenylobacterium sp. J367 TaxID=2898435 RepID=UPI0021519AA5|nr:fasciclin domain-containing protein [Phenylobacterium sp. J367]MCR5879981.1 fasciclin domain-containing protein [Phenylobacterium sp. J367]